MKQAIVIGGSGFVGEHLIRHLLKNSQYELILNVDYKIPTKELTNPRLHYIEIDVRNPIDPSLFSKWNFGSQTVIFNLAAICKIPGFPAIDYFKTNIKGAETVCALGEKLGVKTMVFTSSIAPYGASEELKTENMVPQPDNPYGSSKLVAEYIHRAWQEKENGRNLTILRPGIIFGRNEQANFTRLYYSLKRGFFVYPGRKDTYKACIYVKDVVRACSFFAEQTKGQDILNLVYKNPPTIEEICRAITENTDAGPARFTIPGIFLKGTAGIIYMIGKITGKNFSGIHPDRVEKVMTSTNISGEKLANTSFNIKFDLNEGIREWYNECEGVLY